MTSMVQMAAVLVLGLGVSMPAFSQPAQPGNPPANQMTNQQRIEMLEQAAKAHQAAADCLKAGKTVQECHKVMMDAAPAKGAMNGCPMMGEGMMGGPGMMRGGGPMHGKGMRGGRGMMGGGTPAPAK